MCLPPSPSHLPATLKPNYSRLMSARLGPATRRSQIPSPRGRITPACSTGGVRGAPRPAGAQGRHPQPHMAPASSLPCAWETPLLWPLRWDNDCGEALGCCSTGTTGPSGTPGRLLPMESALDGETRGNIEPAHGAATGTRDELRIQQEGNGEGRELS